MTSERHLDDELFVRWASNELTAAEVAAAQAHVEVCEECSDIWRAVRQVQSEAQEFDAGAVAVPQLSPQRSRLRQIAWSAAALAAAALLAVSMTQLLPTAATDTDPAPSQTSTVRSGTSDEPKPLKPEEGERTAAPEFQWTAVDGADNYVVDLLDESGEILWTSPSTVETGIDWPASVPLDPGLYYWRVTSQALGHDPVSSSLVSFEVTAPGP